jgi:7,8-dihydropterin-6-yl-methyl-4-(beta-D-ribofuranosyl)aminobenzene 5'-phosphate synthase
MSALTAEIERDVSPEEELKSRSLLSLEAVDRVELTTLLDNTIDALLASTDTVKRAPRDAVLGGPKSRLRAEHGFSTLVTVVKGASRHSLLFDAGLTRDGLIQNMEILEVNPSDLRAVVLSHGHADHTLGLVGMLHQRGGRSLPLVIHPDAFRSRKVVFPDGHEIRLPPPSRADLEAEGIALIEEMGPSYLLENMVLITGQVPRQTDFEKGFPIHYAEVDGRWAPDPWIHDDQAIIMRVRGKGLVVLTGCGHSGLINILIHARTLTGGERIHAVLGGFHLAGELFDPIIPDTIRELQHYAPSLIVPGHCTGWKATHAIAAALPQAFVQNSVGTTFIV